MKIYFVAHATTTDNEQDIASGWKDVELSKLGKDQAQELGDRFQDIKIDLVCCSDLKRAVDTVEIAFGDSIPVIVDKRLRELNYGDFNGKSSDMVGPLKRKYLDNPFPNGESYKEAMKRTHEFYKELKEKYSDKTVLVVGHRATHHGLITLTSQTPILQLVNEKFTWQPYWVYEL